MDDFNFSALAGRVAEDNHRVAYTQRRTIDEQTELIEREKVILLQEVHHRVKNNLQIVVSLINLQHSSESNLQIKGALNEIQSRVLSMSLAHQRLNQASDVTKIPLNEYALQLIENINFTKDNENLAFDLKIDESISTDIDTAIPLGLIFNEIIMILSKRADSNLKENKLTIEVVKTDNDKHLILFSDNGSNQNQDESNNGFGLELIDVFVDQINGELNITNENGIAYELKAKLDN